MKIEYVGKLLIVMADLVLGLASEGPNDRVAQALARALRRAGQWLARSR